MAAELDHHWYLTKRMIYPDDDLPFCRRVEHWSRVSSVMDDRSMGGHTSRPDFERGIGGTATVDVMNSMSGLRT